MQAASQSPVGQREGVRCKILASGARYSGFAHVYRQEDKAAGPRTRRPVWRVQCSERVFSDSGKTWLQNHAQGRYNA
jgi:hypothetical protein